LRARHSSREVALPPLPTRLHSQQDAKAAFQRISDAQEAVLKEFFGNPIDFAKVQKSMELFNNFDLVADFAEAIKRLELVAQLATETDPVKIAVLQLRIQALGRLIVNGPDGSVAHVRWAKFANIAIELGISDNLWRNMKAITAKGSSITVKVLSDNDDTKAGIQPAKQNDATIDGERAIYDPLRPKDTDTDAMKNQKIEEIEKKLIDLLKKIRVDRKTLAQLPGLDGDRTLVAAVAASQCFGGNAAVLATQINSAITLSRVGDDLFGFGSDNAG
jgi:hypothetical protein